MMMMLYAWFCFLIHAPSCMHIKKMEIKVHVPLTFDPLYLKPLFPLK